jgi:hypothetical protein
MSKTARSSRFKDLERELKLLRKQLLPAKFSPTGVYPDRTITRTFAYRVLVHAEIEEYLENRVWELALASVKALESTGKVNRVVACLLAFCGQKLELPPETLSPPAGTPVSSWNIRIEFIEKAKASLNSLKHGIDQNHGIREKDLLGLLLPVGIQSTHIDTIWLSTIDTFGRQRGTVAHRSRAVYGATHLPDPSTELSTVKNILIGLREIDNYLNLLAP